MAVKTAKPITLTATQHYLLEQMLSGIPLLRYEGDQGRYFLQHTEGAQTYVESIRRPTVEALEAAKLIEAAPLAVYGGGAYRRDWQVTETGRTWHAAHPRTTATP